MLRFVHVSSVLSAAASVVLLTLGIAATMNSAFADEPLINPCPTCKCPSPPNNCELDNTNCSLCFCRGTCM